MSIRIHYSEINQSVSCPSDGMSLLDASIENKIPHLHECGENGKCMTCRVRILEGIENLSPKTKSEVRISMTRKWDPTMRLACQCNVQGNVVIQ